MKIHACTTEFADIINLAWLTMTFPCHVHFFFEINTRAVEEWGWVGRQLVNLKFLPKKIPLTSGRAYNTRGHGSIGFS
jgi:hypothetical protein